MKRLSVFLLVFIMAASLGVSTACAEGYFAGNLGAVVLIDFDINDNMGKLTFDKSFGLLGAFGNVYDNGFRNEVEVGYRSNDLGEIKIDGVGSSDVDGEITALSLMFNLFYDFAPKSGFSPFIGVGIGGANMYMNDWDSDHVNVLAYQLAIGGSFAASKSLHIDVEYRFFGTSDPDFGGVELEYMSHNYLLGLRKGF